MAPGPHALRLSREEQARYDERGYLVRAAQFDAGELEALRAGAETAAARAREAADRREGYRIDGNRYTEIEQATVQYEHAPGSRTLRVVQPFHPLDDRLDAVIEDPRLVEPMRDLVGCEALSLFTDKLNLKRPGEGSGFGWHQDSPYWNAETEHVDQLPNVMLALDDAHTGNGCLRVIPGSHHRGILPGREGAATLDPLFTHADHFDEASQVAVPLAAGGLCFFGPHVVHGSEPNRSPEPRRALVITYQPAGFPMFRLDAKRDV